MVRHHFKINIIKFYHAIFSFNDGGDFNFFLKQILVIEHRNGGFDRVQCEFFVL